MTIPEDEIPQFQWDEMEMRLAESKEENDLLKVENANLRKQLKIAIEENKSLKGK